MIMMTHLKGLNSPSCVVQTFSMLKRAALLSPSSILMTPHSQEMYSCTTPSRVLELAR